VERVRRYRVDQVDRTRLLVRAILDPGAVASAIEDSIRAALTPVVPRTLRLTIEFVDVLPDGRGPKSRVVFPMA
jgi:hypothetical protein